MSFPANSKYAKEIGVAVSAVLKACDVAQATFQRLVNDETVTKKDKSPVTGELVCMEARHGAEHNDSSAPFVLGLQLQIMPPKLSSPPCWQNTFRKIC